MRYVVLYSGGIDSTVLLYALRTEGHALLALGVDYGQRHRRELDAAGQIARRLAVGYRHIDMPWFGPTLAPSVLVSKGDPIPHRTESQTPTVVPGRNAVLLSIAAAVAQAQRYDGVAAAMHGGDHAVYPDCRSAFLEPLGRALRAGYGVDVLAPFVGWSKAAIVRHGKDLGAPLGQAWSCYRGEARHCGDCGACAERQRAFAEAGVIDPTEYACV